MTQIAPFTNVFFNRRPEISVKDQVHGTFVPGCESVCSLAKTADRCLAGTKGRLCVEDLAGRVEHFFQNLDQ